MIYAVKIFYQPHHTQAPAHLYFLFFKILLCFCIKHSIEEIVVMVKKAHVLYEHNLLFCIRFRSLFVHLQQSIVSN